MSQVREALLSFLEESCSSSGAFPGNPSSVHAHGRRARFWINQAREKIIASLGTKLSPNQLAFTGSGSQANHYVIRQVLEKALVTQSQPLWITTPVEHPSVLSQVEWFQGRGGRVEFLKVDAQGRPLPESLVRLIGQGAACALLSLIWVNNETGVVTDVEAFAEIAAKHKIPLHLDGAQAWGKVSLDLSEPTLQSVEYVTLAPHKIGALPGLGLVWSRQKPKRPEGTENIVGIVAAGAAAQTLNPKEWQAQLSPLKDHLLVQLGSKIQNVKINGEGAETVSNTLNISLPDAATLAQGGSLVPLLDLQGISLSAGAACSSGAVEPSHVLLAMGRSPNEARAALRVSITTATTPDDLNRFVDVLKAIVENGTNKDTRL